MNTAQIQDLINTLKHAAGYGFDLLVRQQLVVGVQEMAGALVFAISAPVAWRIGTKLLAAVGEPRGSNYDDKANGQYSDAQGMAMTAAWVLRIAVLGVALGVGSWFLIDGAGHLINPAGYAITNLIP